MVERMFLSYSQEDEAFCSRLYRDLIKRLHLGNASQVIYFAPNNPMGGVWSPQLWKALEQSPIFLIAVSRYSAASQWVRDEAKRAIELRRKDASRIIIPLMLTPDLGCLPKIHADLEQFHYADFREVNRYEDTLKRLVYILKHPEIVRSLHGLEAFRDYQPWWQKTLAFIIDVILRQ